jgi:hypothetical protein
VPTVAVPLAVAALVAAGAFFAAHSILGRDLAIVEWVLLALAIGIAGAAFVSTRRRRERRRIMGMRDSALW